MMQIVIKTSFPALHCWNKCNIDSVSYLKDKHRHVFYVTMKFKVYDDSDRQIEFIDMKNKVEEYINKNFFNKDLGTMSCEKLCRILMKEFDSDFVSVFEDNENGIEFFK